MTRADDSYPTLQGRADIANAAKASLFVSIHNNAHSDSATSGTETYYAGTPESYSSEGKLLAEAIQRKLIAALGSKDRGAKTHWNELVVLVKTQMPAALVEVGFLSNAAEEAAFSARPTSRKRAGYHRRILEYWLSIKVNTSIVN
jgi:N-acetylmuramoyl-L-alanine amidase